MKITFVTPSDNLTGGTRVVAIYAKLLQQRGHQVMVVCNAPDRPNWREQIRALRRGQWRDLRHKMRPQFGHIAQSGVPCKVLERPRPVTAADVPDADVLIATWWETAVWIDAMPASKGRKVHLIQDYEVWSDTDEIRTQVHAALRLPNCKIVISNSLRETLKDNVGHLPVSVVPNAVDLQLFNSPARNRNTPPTVGFVYGRAPRKAMDRYLQVCALARQKIPDLQIFSFGAEQPIPQSPLPGGTTFHYRPAQKEIAAIYARCDAWLFASRIDSFGLPILEAMACHTPVIGVAVGAAPELLSDGAGVLIDASTEEGLIQQMADAIVRMCSMPAADWQRMSERAHQRAHRYSWQDATDMLETILQRV